MSPRKPSVSGGTREETGTSKRTTKAALLPPVPAKRTQTSQGAHNKTALGDSNLTNVDIQTSAKDIPVKPTIVEIIGPRKSPRTARLMPPKPSSLALGPHRTSTRQSSAVLAAPIGSKATQKGTLRKSKGAGTPSKSMKPSASSKTSQGTARAGGNATPRPTGPGLKQKSKSFSATAAIPLPTAAPTTGSAYTSGKLKMKLNDEENPFLAPASKSKSTATTTLFSKKKTTLPPPPAPTTTQHIQKPDKRAEVAQKLVLLRSKFNSYSFYLQGLDATTKARLAKRIKELGGVIFLHSHYYDYIN